MGSSAPYLQRRGGGFTFRIAVPAELRHQLGVREITKALPSSSSRNEAVALALSLAHQAKHLFLQLRSAMSKSKTSTATPLDFGYTIELDLDDLGFPKRVKVQAEPHEGDAVTATLSAVLHGRARNLPPGAVVPEVSQPPSPPVPLTQVTDVDTSTAVAKGGEGRHGRRMTPMLSEVVQGYLSVYSKKNKDAMLKKHQTVLSMLVEVIGDKPVDELLQADITEFFELVVKLPPRWKDKCRQQGVGIRDLAMQDHETVLGPKAFEDTYIASVRPFLKAARIKFQDQGFPPHLTVEGIEYGGDREGGGSKQRAMKREELVRMFEGPEMQCFAKDHALAHQYWLPHVALFTGARVNEICQLNPQADILQDEESGVWHLWINTKTEADSRIKKSVKTGDDRRVPIHKKLIELGFLDYVNSVKARGEKLLFPQWVPVNKRASGNAEDWFRQFLRDINLRDETPKASLLGMHAFRHTLLTYGAMQKPPLSLFCITGHAQDDLPIPATGAGKGYLTASLLSPLKERSDLLNHLDYNLNFVKPKH